MLFWKASSRQTTNTRFQLEVVVLWHWAMTTGYQVSEWSVQYHLRNTYRKVQELVLSVGCSLVVEHLWVKTSCPGGFTLWQLLALHKFGYISSWGKVSKANTQVLYMHMYLVLSLLLYTIPPSKSLGSICLGPMLCQLCLVVPANGTLYKVINVYYNTTYSMLLVHLISMLVSSSYSNSSVSCVPPGDK